MVDSTKIAGPKIGNDVALTSAKEPVVMPNLMHRVLSKIGFGSSVGSVAEVEAMAGATEQEKVLAYIDQQIWATDVTDERVEQILAKGFETIHKSRRAMFQDHVRRPDQAKISHWFKRLPRLEATIATYVRAIHSKRQLFETVVDFWHNHFNVHAWNKYTQGMIMHYDQQVIRKHAFGNFRQMLLDVTKSTCMLHYLGNAYNEKSAPNENFARELLELYTLGAKSYLGHRTPQDVPVDADGRKVGFVEADVMALSRILTGWSFHGADPSEYSGNRVATGEFIHRPAWQDTHPKVFMGETFEFDEDHPLNHVHQVLDRLAAHPATARHLAEKLCQRYVSDVPPAGLVIRVQKALYDHWQAPDQIQRGLAVLLHSTEFLNTWGEKIKRPFELLASAMRQLNFSQDFNPNNDKTRLFFQKIINTGQAPFHWSLPNGYPDSQLMWLGFSNTMSTWKFIQWMGVQTDTENQPLHDVLQQTQQALPEASDVTAENLVRVWYQKICGCHPPPKTLRHLVDFMASKHVLLDRTLAADEPIDLGSNAWPDFNQDRLVAMVTGIFFTPEFRYR